MQTLNNTKLMAIAGILAMCFLLSGCGKQSAAGGPPRQAAPPEVGVVVIAPQRVPLTVELSGRTSPHLIAEVRPQVGGIIQKRLFAEGAEVTEGQVLYQIDAAPYRAAHASARAAVARAEANLEPLRLKQQRFKDLVQIHAVSQQDYDDVSAALKQAEAEVAVAKAALQAACINLDYTSVKAPISGRIGRSLVTTGALVTASQSVPLATIQQLDPIYVDVTQSSAELLRLKRELAGGTLKNGDAEQARVKLLLEDGSPYPLPGSLKFSDVTVNQSTGSVTLRTLFPNPQQLLLPGMFVRARLEEGVMEQAILAPQRGVSYNPAGKAIALVVGADNKVEQRALQVVRAIGNQWLVSAGLQAGDRLIVEGLQKVRPGSAVKVVTLDQKPAVAAATSVARQ